MDSRFTLCIALALVACGNAEPRSTTNESPSSKNEPTTPNAARPTERHSVGSCYTSWSSTSDEYCQSSAGTDCLGTCGSGTSQFHAEPGSCSCACCDD
jgi:hypothetical protein